MKKTLRKTVAALLVGVMLICSAPLGGVRTEDVFSTTAEAAGCIKTQAQAVKWLTIRYKSKDFFTKSLKILFAL